MSYTEGFAKTMTKPKGTLKHFNVAQYPSQDTHTRNHTYTQIPTCIHIHVQTHIHIQTHTHTSKKLHKRLSENISAKYI